MKAAATLIALGLMAAGAAPAGAALQNQPFDDETLTIGSTSTQRCSAQSATSASTSTDIYVAGGTGTISARLTGSAADDFDLVLSRGGQQLASSSGFGSNESATAYVSSRDQIHVQTCRRKGSGATVARRVFFTYDDGQSRSAPRAQRAVVAVGSRAAERRLHRLGLDVAGHRRARADVLLHSTADRRRLASSGLPHVIADRDAGATLRRMLARGRVRARAAQTHTGTPSGRVSYRSLGQIEEELKGLAERHPTLVRPITLPLRTWEGDEVMGIEIAQNVNASDGRPVYVQLGTHHAREWPSAEAPLEYAHELVKNHLRDRGYLAGRAFDADRDRIVREGRTIVIPVLNPDGFAVSRQAADASNPGSFQRKNCRPPGPVTPYLPCLARALVEGDRGVDLNRNWGLEWGGPGTFGGTPGSVDSQNFSGPAAWSEPETEGIRRLLRDRQSNVVVTNHTYGGVLMRPPGTTRNGLTPDEGLMKPIGDQMAYELDYVSQHSYQLYDTTGSTSDYTYRGLGVFPYTPEIGKSTFFPPYLSGFVPDYDGRVVDGVKRGGLRKAFTIAGLAAIDPGQHALIKGAAPAGRTLRITKTITYITSDRPNENGHQFPVVTFTEPRVSTMTVPADGQFTWHVSPSPQPLDRVRATWRLTCESGGQVLEQRDVRVERGQVADVGSICPVPPPPAPVPQSSAPGPEAGPPPPLVAAPSSPSCARPAPAFRSVGARPRGRSVLLRFSRILPEEVTIRITQLTRGSRKLEDPVVVRRVFRERSFVWSGRDAKGRRVGSGLYAVTFSMPETDDVRRLTLRKRGGRFRVVGAPTAVTDCG